MDNVWIVIAAFNEAKRIGSVLAGLKEAGYTNIVVVDDCSSDDTSDAVRKGGVTVLRHVINRGQGAALCTGIDYALSHGAEYIITFDADGQHRVEDLPAMLKPVIEGDVDITVGSRFLHKTSVPFMRKVLLKGSIFIVWLFYGMKMTDAHNGFRVMTRKAAQTIDIKQDRMAHASEIVGEIRRHNLRYKEIPVIIRYSEETIEKGHGGIRQAFKVLWNMILERVMK